MEIVKLLPLRVIGPLIISLALTGAPEKLRVSRPVSPDARLMALVMVFPAVIAMEAGLFPVLPNVMALEPAPVLTPSKSVPNWTVTVKVVVFATSRFSVEVELSSMTPVTLVPKTFCIWVVLVLPVPVLVTVPVLLIKPLPLPLN